MQKNNLLYIIKTMDVGGAERVVFELSSKLSEKYNITILSSGGIFIKQLEEQGVKCISREISDYGTPKKLFNVYKIIKTVVRSNSYQIIHTHHRMLQFLVQLIVGRNITIYTAHNYFVDFRQLFLFPKVLVSCSNYIYKFSREIGSKKTKKVVINNGVKKNVQSKALLTEILFIGRFTKNKGILNIIKAFQLLNETDSNFRLKLVGKQNRLINNELIKKLKLDKNVIIADPTLNLQPIYENAGILLLPSEVPEGLPISILEAMSNRVLVVATLAGGISEVLKDKETGFTLRSSNPEEIFSRLLEIVNEYSSIEIEKIKTNAEKLITNNYSLEKMIAKYEKIYSNINKI